MDIKEKDLFIMPDERKKQLLQQAYDAFHLALPDDHLYFEEAMRIDHDLAREFDELVYSELRKYRGAGDISPPEIAWSEREFVIPAAQGKNDAVPRKFIRGDHAEGSEEGAVVNHEMENKAFAVERFDFNIAAFRHWNLNLGEDIIDPENAVKVLHRKRADSIIIHGRDCFGDKKHMHVRAMHTFRSKEDLTNCTYAEIFLYTEGTRHDIGHKLTGFLHYIRDRNTRGNSLAERYEEDIRKLSLSREWEKAYMEMTLDELERYETNKFYWQEAEDKKTKDIARNLLSMGMSSKQIMQATGISLKELNQLKTGKH